MGGSQRKRLSRAERQNNGPHRNLDRQGAADQKAELVRRMREKAGAAEAADPQHRFALVIFGLVVSIPLIVWGSQLVLKLLDRFPIVITLGAALLGWIAGGLIINDPAGDRWPVLDTPLAEYGMSIAGALFVVILGYVIKRRNARSAAA